MIIERYRVLLVVGGVEESYICLSSLGHKKAPSGAQWRYSKMRLVTALVYIYIYIFEVELSQLPYRVVSVMQLA